MEGNRISLWKECQLLCTVLSVLFSEPTACHPLNKQAPYHTINISLTLFTWRFTRQAKAWVLGGPVKRSRIVKQDLSLIRSAHYLYLEELRWGHVSQAPHFPAFLIAPGTQTSVSPQTSRIAHSVQLESALISGGPVMASTVVCISSFNNWLRWTQIAIPTWWVFFFFLWRYSLTLTSSEHGTG